MVCSWARARILVPSSPQSPGCVPLSQAAAPHQREQSLGRGQAACIAAVPGSELLFRKSSASGLGEIWLSLKEELPNFWLLQTRAKLMDPRLSSLPPSSPSAKDPVALYAHVPVSETRCVQNPQFRPFTLF